MQSLVAVSRTLCPYVKNMFGDVEGGAGPHILGEEIVSDRETRLPPTSITMPNLVALGQAARTLVGITKKKFGVAGAQPLGIGDMADSLETLRYWFDYLRAVSRKVLWSSVCLSVCAHSFCPQDISRTGSWITTKFGGWEQGVNL